MTLATTDSDTPREAATEIKQAEQAVLGSAMTTVSAASELLERCPPERFYRPQHQVIAAIIADLAGQGNDVDPQLVLAELHKSGDLDRCGGGPYLHELYAAALPLSGALKLADDVVADHARRQVHELGQALLQRADNHHRWTAESMQSAVELVEQKLTLGTDEVGEVATLAEDIDQVWEEVLNPQPPRITTGLADLDEQVLLEAGDMTTLAARTSVGKSMVAGTIAQHVAIDQQVPVLFAALEMSRTQMVQRTLAARARVRHEALKRPGKLEQGDVDRMRRVRNDVAGAPLYSDYASSIGLAHLRQRLRWLIRTCQQNDQLPPGLVVVDYLGIMRATHQYERRQLELADAMQGLRALAGEFDLHILVVHQLNRDAHGRTPQLTDLRESGDIEQDSANVLLLNLPDTEAEPHRTGEMDIVVAKNRHGNPGITIPVSHQPHYQRVGNLSRKE